MQSQAPKPNRDQRIDAAIAHLEKIFLLHRLHVAKRREILRREQGRA